MYSVQAKAQKFKPGETAQSQQEVPDKSPIRPLASVQSAQAAASFESGAAPGPRVVPKSPSKHHAAFIKSKSSQAGLGERSQEVASSLTSADSEVPSDVAAAGYLFPKEPVRLEAACPWFEPVSGFPRLEPTQGPGFDPRFDSYGLHVKGLSLPNEAMAELFDWGFLASMVYRFQNNFMGKTTRGSADSGAPEGLPLAVCTHRGANGMPSFLHSLHVKSGGEVSSVVLHGDAPRTRGPSQGPEGSWAMRLCSLEELGGLIKEALREELLGDEGFKNLAVVYLRVKIAEEQILCRQLKKVSHAAVLDIMDPAETMLIAWVNSAINEVVLRVMNFSMEEAKSLEHIPGREQLAALRKAVLAGGLAQASWHKAEQFVAEATMRSPAMEIEKPQRVLENYRKRIMPVLARSRYKTPLL